MPRSLVLPLVALAGIVLYGTTQAARPALPPPAESAAEAMAPARVEPMAPPPRAMPPPPPAPRLQSEVEAEARAQAARDSAATRESRSVAPDESGTGGVGFRTGATPDRDL
ncbi:hypothetical protein [Rubrivirga sp. IMCC45206]|uniref:hypothetical protein n=1 Tax=Rubrivirga sp. IMCC45206 TaxID=3391614 RepID=UPI00398FFD45